MSYLTSESDTAVVLSPPVPANACVIWLHGLGADGYDFVPIVDELRLPPAASVRFIFPHARPRPVTINNGYVMRAWYDIRELSAGAIQRSRSEDEAGIRESEKLVRDLIENEAANGIPVERTILAGFSQGGAIALHTALRYPQRLAGAMALSAYLPLRESLDAEVTAVSRELPILMCHGSRDPIVPLPLGKASCELLVQRGYRIEWCEYPMEHSVCAQEVADISRWLGAVLAPARSA